MTMKMKDKIVSIIRADFDQTPKNWNGDDWFDNAEEVADAIIALFQAPAAVDVDGLVARLGERWGSTDDPVSKKINRRLALCREAATALTAAEARIKMAADALRHADAYLMSIGHGDGTDGARIRIALSTLTGARDAG